MTERELQELRSEKWRVNGRPIRTLEDAQEFIESVGFCLMYPVRPPVLVPTFVGAYVGSGESLPTWQHAFADKRAMEAQELMVRLLRQKMAYEANLFSETPFLVAASVFPFFYGLVGDRNPRQVPKSGPRSEYSPLAVHTFQAIQKQGPIAKPRLREILGGDLSIAALDRALNELWSKLRITRVDYNPEEGASWDILFRWSPDPVREGMNLSIPEALTALVSKYVDSLVAVEQGEIEEFFSNLIARSRTREAINALLAARELQYVTIGGRTMIQITPPRPAPVERPPRPVVIRTDPSRTIARRPRPVPAKTPNGEGNK
ncbi:MAG: crosslink repair DNA glycosylase YcaQ family protein [Terriglobia bacterium]|jgi:hypothetical protein|nr:crosslink repair DNA glycosylase YcaQ family protein [Terriglobia bacterium]